MTAGIPTCGEQPWERGRGQRLPAGGTQPWCWGPWHGTWCATPSTSTFERMDLHSQAACRAFCSAEPSLESSASGWLKSPLSKEHEPKLHHMKALGASQLTSEGTWGSK